MFQAPDRMRVVHMQPSAYNKYNSKIDAIDSYARERTVNDGLSSRDRELLNPSSGVKHAQYAKSVKHRIQKKKDEKVKKYQETTDRIVQKAVYSSIVEGLLATHANDPAKKAELEELLNIQEFRRKEDDLLTLSLARQVLGVGKAEELPESVLDEVIRVGNDVSSNQEIQSKNILDTLLRYKKEADIEGHRGRYGRAILDGRPPQQVFPNGAAQGSAPFPDIDEEPGTKLSFSLGGHGYTKEEFKNVLRSAPPISERTFLGVGRATAYASPATTADPDIKPLGSLSDLGTGTTFLRRKKYTRSIKTMAIDLDEVAGSSDAKQGHQ